ncbi:MAG TPA: AmmeMemoRadiSam system radical SAM enzyme [Tissierellia bacterium]|nr:AmmeMemoRadiSam system radical SAM enzyme [Tissierellia bacterium]
MKVQCQICPHHCKLEENQRGLCRGRGNVNGEIVALNYGLITSIALDPIEKKPLRNFYPGKNILSIGSFGCNLKCLFCQNHQISMVSENDIPVKKLSPEELIEIAIDLKPRENIGIAYTYNEPLIGYEYLRDCAKLARENNLKNVVVTNGFFCQEPMKELLPHIDALNVDLKGFSDDFYKKVGGKLDTVKDFIELAARYCHVEVTTLIIPGENDKEDEIRELSKFLASINPDIPLHITRFFPNYKMMDKRPTEIKTIFRLANIARKNLKYVYEGNCR